MGRQKGDGARSKNRPSSSSLAASLLPSGVSSVGFGGYTGSSRLASPQTSDQDTLLPSDVDGELAQHLRRLGRKDPTTKMKALASLSTLIKQRSAEEVTQIVPQWAFEYKRLLHDYNREVRRATHDTMTNLVVTVGRGLAPHLKSLMGPWWFSQFDPVSEISQAARRSLQAAFPASERRLEALILCASEIFLFLDENLKLTPQAMSDKATPMDELEEMHQRVVSSSLLALATFIDILLGMQSQRQHFDTLTSEPKNAARAKATAISYSERMFSTHKYFLEFFKSQSLGVRSATYSVITCFIKHIPDAFNEGNMKTLSSAILGSFQEKEPACHSSMWDMILIFSRRFPESWSLGITNKMVVPRFWCFLRNGCYGSQQVSYPNLVSFLDSIPPKAIVADRFFLNFFHNLWAGRNPYHSLSSDRLAFFKALGECFLWGINNASRYFEGVDAISHFQLTLVEDVLVTLLWRDYFLFASQKIEDGLASGKSSSIDHHLQHVQEKPTETVSIRYPISYLQDLGKCIIEILLEISLKSCNLLSAFCAPFLKECMEIFQQEESGEHVEQIINFMLLLEQHAVQKGEKWPLVYLAGPLVVNSFPLIKSLDLPASVKLLSVIIGIFGPREIVLQFFLSQNGEPRSHFVDEDGYRLKLEHFMQVFNNDFVPWCLHGNSCSTSARLDLLLALLDVELFHDQWFSILTCATELNESSKFDDGSLVVDRIDILAMLMEKVRGRIVSKNLENQSNCPGFSQPEHWQHKLLNSAAVSVSRQAPPFHSSHAKFLRAVLGGSAEDDNICFLSQETVILVFEEILRRISLLLTVSPFSWARHASSVILCTETKYLMLGSQPDIGKMLKIAKSAFDVLKGSFFCLKALDGDFELVPRILAAIFFSDWEGSMISQVAAHGTSEILESEMEVKCLISKSETAVDDNSQKKLDVMYLGESAHAFRCQIDVNFWKSLNSFTLQRLQYMLVKVIRFAVFGDDGFGADNLPAVCSKWVMDMVGPIFRDHKEEQLMLDQLLCEGESWPLWVAPLVNDRIRTVILKDENTFMDGHGFGQRRFVSFVVNLVSILGVGKVIAGSISEGHCPPLTAVQDAKVLSSASYSRAWIAAEIICTWKWHEGSALSSFLPLLCEYARVRNYSPGDKLFDSLFCILLDGALADRSSIRLSPLNVWTPSDNEVDSIQDPFLRALVSLLLGLFIKDNIWGKGEAGLIFEFIVNKLFIGMAVSRSCLRILPYILNILVQPLRNKSTIVGESGKELPSDTLMDEKLNNTILSWLERALCIPPLILWQPEQLDLENWVHVAIACYPLNTTGGMKKIQMVSLKNVRDLERKLLYGLFQKQRSFGNLTKSYTVSAATQIPLAASSSTNIEFSLSLQTTLANLTAVSVGYCWQDFSEDDWNFVMSHLHRWTESAVLVMEEMAENLDGTIIRSPVSDNATILSRKLEVVAQIVNPFPVDIARIALFIFSLYLGLTELGNAEGSEILMSLRMGQWDRIKDRIFEDALRLFFATGVAESIASCLCEGGGSIIASTRHKHPHFWELVAVTVINSPCQVRKTAMHSVELWGLCKGPISSLYAILFSSEPITCLQFAAYMILSTEPVCTLAITKEVSGAGCVDGDLIGNQECDQSQAENVELPSEKSHFLVDEISCMIEKPPIELLEMDLVAQDRVNFFLAWALLLTHLQSLPPLSPAREKLVQYLQDSTSSSTILDCLFQNIPLILGTSSTLKKKDVELSEEASCAATASKRAITECSLFFSVESLWPVGTEQMASLSGAIYGLMLRVLPAYVRNWFNGLRDRSMTCAIENFTKACCSLHLLADELSQIKGAVVADENFSISVNKSTYEVTATYKKEETGMDLVIRLPSCYPLSPVDVDCTRNLGISEVKQRKWMLSMAAFVRNQNGALTEAIKIWKSNFDKEFEGIEECPICYSIIHTTNHNLPRMACKTCKHKFHSACLYKWFSTSHKSTCPLCQTPF